MMPEEWTECVKCVNLIRHHTISLECYRCHFELYLVSNAPNTPNYSRCWFTSHELAELLCIRSKTALWRFMEANQMTELCLLYEDGSLCGCLAASAVLDSGISMLTMTEGKGD